jgi:PPOX class probable F420-dependent enzyme
MRMAIPREIEGQKYISLTTFRKNGVAVQTPVWFGEEGGKLYVVSKADSGKCKRIRNNSRVRIAPCTIRGKITGPEFEARARILPPEHSPRARATVRRKYWLARIPSPWRKTSVYLEIDVAAWNSPPAVPGAP